MDTSKKDISDFFTSNGFNLIETEDLSLDEKQILINLWNREYPQGLSHSSLNSFNHYLDGLSNVKHFLLKELSDGQIKGWAFKFYRDNAQWFAIILSATIHSKGLGRMMIELLKLQESELNGWVIDHDLYKKTNGDTYFSPLSFYEKCGFEILPEQRIKSDILSAVRIKWTTELSTKDNIELKNIVIE